MRCLYFLLASCISLPLYAQEQIRTVDICLLNNEQYPATHIVLYEAINEVSQEYEKNESIRFNIVGIYPAADVFTNGPHLARGICPENTEIIGMFSNREPEDGSDVIGVEFPAISVFSIVAVQRMHEAENRSGQSLLVHAIKHEIGHIFLQSAFKDNVDDPSHALDERSFMYWALRMSYGEWTPFVIEKIRENRNRALGSFSDTRFNSCTPHFHSCY